METGKKRVLKNPGYRDFKKSWYWKKISDIFLTHFLVNFRPFYALIDQKVEKQPFLINFAILIHVCNSRFFGPLKVDLLDAKGHFSCFFTKVSFSGGDRKKMVFSHFLFSIKKIHKFTVFRL